VCLSNIQVGNEEYVLEFKRRPYNATWTATANASGLLVDTRKQGKQDIICSTSPVVQCCCTLPTSAVLSAQQFDLVFSFISQVLEFLLCRLSS
jgi:hypothetical protein